MIKKIAVLGAGQMGQGIAQVCAKAGYSLILYDIQNDFLEKSLSTLDLEMEKSVARGKMSSEDKTESMARLQITDQLEKCGSCDLVIEAIVEDFAEKEALFQKLIPFLHPKTYLASNTSSLSITGLASLTDRPSKFMGLHFMNPVVVMPLVELIRGLSTAPETFEAIKDVVLRLGKNYAESQDYPGFIVNRILAPLINEGIYALYEGVGSLQTIDMAMRLGTNQPMGPLELADFIGLDTCLAILRLLSAEFGGARYHPCPLLVKYVEVGWLGRKTGRGFYDYRHSPPTPTR